MPGPSRRQYVKARQQLHEPDAALTGVSSRGRLLAMVVVALRGSNIPVRPVPQHNSALSLAPRVPVERRGTGLPLTRNSFRLLGREQWRLIMVHNETE